MHWKNYFCIWKHLAHISWLALYVFLLVPHACIIEKAKHTQFGNEIFWSQLPNVWLIPNFNQVMVRCAEEVLVSTAKSFSQSARVKMILLCLPDSRRSTRRFARYDSVFSSRRVARRRRRVVVFYGLSRIRQVVSRS